MKTPNEGEITLDDAEYHVVLAYFIERKLRGLPLEPVPNRIDMTKLKKLRWRDLVRREKTGAPAEGPDLFRMPFWLPTD
jgi:hypothetical protein